MHLASAQREVDLVEGDDAGKALADTARAEPDRPIGNGGCGFRGRDGHASFDHYLPLTNIIEQNLTILKSIDIRIYPEQAVPTAVPNLVRFEQNRTSTRESSFFKHSASIASWPF